MRVLTFEERRAIEYQGPESDTTEDQAEIILSLKERGLMYFEYYFRDEQQRWRACRTPLGLMVLRIMTMADAYEVK